MTMTIDFGPHTATNNNHSAKISQLDHNVSGGFWLDGEKAEKRCSERLQ
jgi:hypothetical protein